MAEKTQKIVTQKGDRLIDLCKRIYVVRDPDQALAIATVVASATPKNDAVLNGKIGVPLAAGIAIEFPPWSEVSKLIQARDSHKAQALSKMQLEPKSAGSVAPGPVVSAGKHPVGERALPKEMASALGLGAQEALDELRLLSHEEAEAQPPSEGAAKMSALGAKLADQATPATLAELLGQTEKGFFQSFALMLQKLNPRTFSPGTDVDPTLMTLTRGFFAGLEARMLREMSLELERRKKLLERVFLRLKSSPLSLLPDVPASRSFGADAATALAAIEQALAAAAGGAIEGVAPRVLDQLSAQYGLSGSAMAQEVSFPRASIEPPPLLSFLDALAPGGDDGPLAQKLLELATRVSDTHRAAVQQASALTGGLSVVEKDTPSEALAEHLPVVLEALRALRESKTGDDQARLMADERHLLAGRNFVNFRKDISLALDKRLTLAVHLSPVARVTVLLALYMQDGHRLQIMRTEEIEAACERFIQALAAIG